MPEEQFVSVLVPIRNEARYIGRCLGAILSQDYPRDRLEILVLDGMSDDGTRAIVADLAARDSRLRLVDNPARIVPTALNRGLRAARGDVIIRVDGHAVIAPDYVRRSVERLGRVDADCVGGPIQTVGETWVARAIAIGQSSPFGVGNAAFRYAREGQYVDTLAFGAYRRQVFERIGLFDEELVRNQDDEFNFRLLQAGGKIWLDPAIHSVYFSRASLRSLWQQYFEYGFWKVRVFQKHGRPASARQLVPPAFVLGLMSSAVISAVTGSLFWFICIAGLYVLVSFGACLWVASRRGLTYLPLLPLVFATMHFAYGLGFLMGLVHFSIGKTRVVLKSGTNQNL